MRLASGTSMPKRTGGPGAAIVAIIVAGACGGRATKTGANSDAPRGSDTGGASLGLPVGRPASGGSTPVAAGSGGTGGSTPVATGDGGAMGGSSGDAGAAGSGCAAITACGGDIVGTWHIQKT